LTLAKGAKLFEDGDPLERLKNVVGFDIIRLLIRMTLREREVDNATHHGTW